MNDIKEKVKTFLNKYNLLQPETKVLAAFSGGFDSMCLLHILKELNANVMAIHLNHNWRGNESLADEARCMEFCRLNNIEFYSEKLSSDIPKTETAARNARYEFFENCAKKFYAKAVLTAHNANDNAETLIYRITKGTGITGLSGIAEVRDIFYRPFLNCKREEIEQYCKENKLCPNIDSSNEDTKYKRNLIRHNVLPELEKINKDVVDAFNSLSETAKSDNEIIEEYLKSIKNPYKTDVFINLSNAVKTRLVYNLFTKNNLDYDKTKIERVLNFIIKNANSKSGKKCSLSADLELFVNDKQIEIINIIDKAKLSLKIDKEGEYDLGKWIFTINKCTCMPEKFLLDSEMKVFVNLELLQSLTLRTRENGDYISPLNAGGKQKLKKYLNEKKVPTHTKDELLFLTSGAEILWAPSLGINDKIKVVKNPTHVLKLVSK